VVELVPGDAGSEEPAPEPVGDRHGRRACRRGGARARVQGLLSACTGILMANVLDDIERLDVASVPIVWNPP
jgi:hypothetical protein